MFVNDVGLNARVQPRLFPSVFPGFPDFFFSFWFLSLVELRFRGGLLPA